MSASFVAGSSQYITQTDALLVPGGPWAVGLWVKVEALPGTDQEVVSIAAAAAQRTWEIYIKSTGSMGFGYFNGTALGYVDLPVSSITAGVWTYLLVRSISTTNRRISTWRPGAVNHAQNTTSFTAGALDRINIGALVYNNGAPATPFTGKVAEFFYANEDIQPGGALMDENLLRQVAFMGPLSVPHIVPLVVEYHSLQGPMEQVSGSDYQSGAGRSWVAVNGPTFGEHPPLDPAYVRPNQAKRLLAV